MSSASQQPEALLAWMSGLADATRLRLLRLLERHELGVVELCEIVQLPQSTVSRHLKVLADEGWVSSARRGTTHFYRMRLDQLASAARRLWLLSREQTDSWATVRQDELRLARRLQDRENATQAFFAGAAAQWDKIRGELYGESFALPAMLALLPSHLVVADLGCGTGQLIAELAPHVQRIIAVDNSAAMLRAAHKRTAGLNNVDLRRGDLTDLPIDDASCDAALLILALTYVADPSAALRQARRILLPTARMIILDLLPHDRDDFRRQMNQQHAGFAAPAMEAMLTACGFVRPAVRPLPPVPSAKGPALFLATAEK